MRVSATGYLLVAVVLSSCGGSGTDQSSTVSVETSATSASPTVAVSTAVPTTTADSPATTATQPAGDTVIGDEVVVVPAGLEYELMTMPGVPVVEVPAGGSRELTVLFSDVGSLAGVWTVETELRLREGATVSGAPDLLDFTVEPERSLSVTVAVPADAPVGLVGGFNVFLTPPEGGVSSSLAGVRFGVEVVPAGSPIGPSAFADVIAGSSDGSCSTRLTTTVLVTLNWTAPH